jgi:hypothetical protein
MILCTVLELSCRNKTTETELSIGVAGGHIMIQTGRPYLLHLSIERPALRFRTLLYSIEYQNDCYRKLHYVEATDRGAF